MLPTKLETVFIRIIRISILWNLDARVARTFAAYRAEFRDREQKREQERMSWNFS